MLLLGNTYMRCIGCTLVDAVAGNDETDDDERDDFDEDDVEFNNEMHEDEGADEHDGLRW